MRFSLGIITTRHTASLYANVKHVVYKHKKSAAYSYLLLPKNINTDGVGGLGCSMSGQHLKNK